MAFMNSRDVFHQTVSSRKEFATRFKFVVSEAFMDVGFFKVPAWEKYLLQDSSL